MRHDQDQMAIMLKTCVLSAWRLSTWNRACDISALGPSQAGEGLYSWAISTGFIGLVAADLIQPWATFVAKQ